MNRTDELINRTIQLLEKWKREGILEEKLKEYGFTLSDEQVKLEAETENES